VRVTLPNGTVIQARGLSDYVSVDGDRDPDYGLYLDDRWKHRVIPWPHVFVDWDDFGLPQDERSLFDAIRHAWEIAQTGASIEVGCYVGTGRTGTTVACLAVLGGVDAANAVVWTRENYDPWAVEGAQQEDLVSRFASWIRDRPSR